MAATSNMRKPPFASAETLFSVGGVSQQPSWHASTSPLSNMMSFEQFKRLDADGKQNEIHRLLPLLSPLARECGELREELESAQCRVEEQAENRRNEERNEDRREEAALTSRHITHTINDATVTGFSNTADDVSSFCSMPCLPAEQPVPDPFIISKSRQLNKRVVLNVGGIRHEVMWRMLEQVPDSRLGLLAQARTHADIMAVCSDYSLVDNEFFFDRHPRSFNTILNFYRTGKLHLADEMCVLAFGEDLVFWMIDATFMESCCSERFFSRADLVQEEMEDTTAKLEKDDEEDFGTGKFAKYQKMMWDLIEKPDTSMAAHCVSVISTSFVAISIVGMTVSTLPALQYQDAQGRTLDNPSLAMIETVSIAWFTLEYFIRLAGAPQKCDFLKDGMNIVDVLAIMPFFVTLFMAEPLDVETNTEGKTLTTLPPADLEEESGGMEDILQIFRIFKLARVLKLARHSPGLQAIVYTLRESYKELALLVFLVVISGFIFASLCFFIEIEEDSGFTSIPTAFYWVVITMTTVGYGDIAPTTGLGKFVGTMCAVSGVLVLSLPIPIIAGNFEDFHRMQQTKTKAEKAKKKLTEAKASEEAERVAFCKAELRRQGGNSTPQLPSSGRSKTWQSGHHCGPPGDNRQARNCDH